MFSAYFSVHYKAYKDDRGFAISIAQNVESEMNWKYKKCLCIPVLLH